MCPTENSGEKPEAGGWGPGGGAMLIGKYQMDCLWEEDLEMLSSNWMGATGTQRSVQYQQLLCGLCQLRINGTVNNRAQANSG